MAGVNIDTKGIGEAVGAVGGLLKDARAAITGKAVLDPDKEAELELKWAEIESNLLLAQAKINEAETLKGGFAGNWRPFLGWVCGLAFAYQFLFAPLGTWALGLAGIAIAAPRLDMSELSPLVLGMLGLGLVGARSYEKAKGVAR